MNTSFKPTPFTADDLYRPSSEGRSLHDQAAYFYRKVFKIPHNTTYVPKWYDVGRFLKSLGPENVSKHLTSNN